MSRSVVQALVVVLLAAPWGHARAQLTPLSTPLERAGFERTHHSRAVTVYSHKQSKVLHFAAEGRFAASPTEVQAVLLDYKLQARHIGRLSEVRILKRRPDALAVYIHLNLPIISDRDYTLKLRWDERDGVRRIRFRASPDGPPPRKGVVRMTLNGGSWQLRPIRGGRETFARYELRMDIAGWIPTWLVRRSAGKEIPEVFAQFAKMLAKRRR